eukprot:SAG22_NODE_10460_length_534_cov_0.983908_1_plen_34_part_10
MAPKSSCRCGPLILSLVLLATTLSITFTVHTAAS